MVGCCCEFRLGGKRVSIRRRARVRVRVRRERRA